MQHSIKITFVVAFTLATSAVPSFATGATVAMEPNCATADTRMIAMAKSMPSMTPSGNLDRDFMAMSKHTMMMMSEASKLEMACGKDSHARDTASSISKQNRELLNTLMIGVGSTH